MISSLALHQRSYGALQDPDRHTYAQLVLPVAGEVRLEIEGRAGRLDPLHGALVAPGAWHAQCSTVGNRSLILDVGADAIKHGVWQRLLDQPFIRFCSEKPRPSGRGVKGAGGAAAEHPFD